MSIHNHDGCFAGDMDTTPFLYPSIETKCDITVRLGTQPRLLCDKLKEAVNALDFGAKGDKTINDTTAFLALEKAIEGEYIDLEGLTYRVDKEPRGNMYYNGGFIVNDEYIYKDVSPYPTPFGLCNIKPIVSDYDAHVGFNNCLFDVGQNGDSKLLCVYRRAPKHGLFYGAQVLSKTSYDNGMTWIENQLVYKRSLYDVRNFVGAVMGNGRAGLICSRRGAGGAYVLPVFIYSDDQGATWKSREIVPPVEGFPVNFHGALLRYPASVGGHDTLGWIAYSYRDGQGAEGGIDAFYTINNGNTWSIAQNVALPDATGSSGPGLTYSLLEMAVERVGEEDKWLMLVRNSAPTPIGNGSNAVAYVSTDMLRWSGPVDTGLLLRSNPPQLIYEGGRFWFIVFSRKGRPVVPNLDSHLVVASAPAHRLWDADGNFSTLQAGWQVITQIPAWDTGYIHPYRINHKWLASFVVSENASAPNRGLRNVLALVGDFHTTATSHMDVLSLAPRPNLIVNGNLQLWNAGDSFTNSGSSLMETADNVFIANRRSAEEALTATKRELALGQIDVLGQPANFINLSGTAAEASGQYVAFRIQGIRKLALKRMALSFYAAKTGSAETSIAMVKYSVNYGTGGTPSEPDVGTVATGILLPYATWQRFEYAIDFPQMNYKTLGTNGDDYALIYFYMPSGSYGVGITGVKLEDCEICTPPVVLSDREELMRLTPTPGPINVIHNGTLTVKTYAFPMTHIIDTEDEAATDELTTIRGGVEGQIIVLRTATYRRKVTVKKSTEYNLWISEDFLMSHAYDTLTLIKSGARWYELARSING